MFLIIFSFIYSSFFATHIKLITGGAFSSASIVGNKWMSIFTNDSSFINSSWAIAFKRILFMTYEMKMVWVYTSSIIANMIKFFVRKIVPYQFFTSFPNIKKLINIPILSSKIYSSISIIQFPGPIPAFSNWINRNIWKNSFSLFSSKHTQIIPHYLPIVKLPTWPENWRILLDNWKEENGKTL